MTRKDLIEHIHSKKTCLCVGLDPDHDKIPVHLKHDKDWIYTFNCAVIDAVAEYCVAFKPNVAFYESYGSEGWSALERTVHYIRTKYPIHFVIADAKRGDIGNTSSRYAKAFFDHMDCHAITVAPYMGEDSVSPFLEFPGKWTIVLALTSNKGSQNFQHYGEPDLYQRVISQASIWGNEQNLMFVAGATHGYELKEVRKAAGNHFLLVPGVGAQGGDVKMILESVMLKDDVGILINSSRGIIYAGSGEDFADKAREVAAQLSSEIAMFL